MLHGFAQRVNCAASTLRMLCGQNAHVHTPYITLSLSGWDVGCLVVLAFPVDPIAEKAVTMPRSLPSLGGVEELTDFKADLQ